ncbi:renalase isoform X2 [Vigna umbellata]|uniref:renalase isoform X2 n=1 Tax=Vigna umbellata TaxID=87088 RepID=UPI001F5E90A5|nr:renalase isoform X2 [Vigna umbellata]
MSQRREKTEDGQELHFDHGAPFFSVGKSEVLRLVEEWVSRGLVAEWNEKFGFFDFHTHKFKNIEQEGLSKRYVGVPGMNAICKSLGSENGVESKFGVGIGRIEWLHDDKEWSLTGVNGQNLGQFKGLVASDKNIVSPRITQVTGRLPLLGMDTNLVPELSEKLLNLPVKPCFIVMLAFAEPLSTIPVKAFSFENSKVLSRAYCDSSKPSRSTASERWVLHSTPEYAEDVIALTGLNKPSDITLNKVAEQLLQEFQSTGLIKSPPFFKKAHRWGSAFPAASIAPEEKCLWDRNKRLAICGDFCVSPNVEGAIDSGLAAALKLTDSVSSL